MSVCPAARSWRASLRVMVAFQLLHQRWSALVLSGSRGLPPRERGMSSSMTVSVGSWWGASGLRGCPQSAQWVLVALMRATSWRRLCPFRLWGLMSLVRGMCTPPLRVNHVHPRPKQPGVSGKSEVS